MPASWYGLVFLCPPLLSIAILGISSPVNQKHLQKEILVVDDEPIIGELVCALFEDFGFKKIRSISDPHQLFEEIKLSRPSLIILDIFMPALSGLELLRKLRSRIEYDDILILMLSSADQNEKYKSLEMGAAGFVQKPVSKKLVNAVCRAFDVASFLQSLGEGSSGATKPITTRTRKKLKS